MKAATTVSPVCSAIERALDGEELSALDGYALMKAEGSELTALMAAAVRINDTERPLRLITYSRKVFLPLTNLCRDRCGYCTFVKGPRQKGAHTMPPHEVLSVARRGAELGCKEALLSLGDHPELRHAEMRSSLRAMGFSSTPEYVASMSKLILEETGLLPHTNCGTLNHDEMAEIAPYNVSMGIMLESSSIQLHEPGGAHHGTTTKLPQQRVATLETAAGLGMAMTTGILIGIGETSEDRIDSLLMIRDLQQRFGNIQEVIVQNFRAKDSTRMRLAREPSTIEMLRTLAITRLLLGPTMNIQAPPNLNLLEYRSYLSCGINDWGGVSPLTKDFINPEAAWPEIRQLDRTSAEAGYRLRERAALYPDYLVNRRWPTSSRIASRLAELTDQDGYIKEELERW